MKLDYAEMFRFMNVLTLGAHVKRDVDDFDLYDSLYRCASEYKLKEVLELGTGDLGESGLAFMSAGAKLTTVDVNKDRSENSMRVYEHFGLTPEKVITADDREPNFVEDRRWDAIFIDTSHMYEHTLIELEYCCTRTNCILMDDFWWGDEKDPGIIGAVKVFLENHPEWKSEKPEWSRVGILTK